MSVYGEPFQRGVLYWMLKDHAFCQKGAAFLKEDYFTGELKWFLRKIKGHFKDHLAIIGLSDLKNETLKHSSKDQEKYEKEYENIISSKDFSFQYIRKELTGFVRANIFIAAYKEASCLFNSSQQNEAYDITKRRLEELIKVDFENTKISEFGDYQVVCDEAAKQKENAIPTGIKFIDEAMNGGLMPQTWTTFLGGSNVGKSMLCPNLAYHAAKKGKRVFVTIHEDEENPTKRRYLSRFSGIPINRLAQPRNGWSLEEERKVAEADAFLKKYVRIRFMYGPDCFLEKVVDAVRLQKMEWDFELFLCDTGQCLKSTAYKALEDKYGLQEYIYSELKQICLDIKIAGAGGAQVNRMGHKVNKSGASLLRMTDVGDSWGICKKSSNVITMNRSDLDVGLERIVFLLDKVRDGICPVAVQCTTDYSKATTHVDYDATKANQNELTIDEGETK